MNTVASATFMDLLNSWLIVCRFIGIEKMPFFVDAFTLFVNGYIVRYSFMNSQAISLLVLKIWGPYWWTVIPDSGSLFVKQFPPIWFLRSMTSKWTLPLINKIFLRIKCINDAFARPAPTQRIFIIQRTWFWFSRKVRRCCQGFPAFRLTVHLNYQTPFGPRSRDHRKDLMVPGCDPGR